MIQNRWFSWVFFVGEKHGILTWNADLEIRLGICNRIGLREKIEFDLELSKKMDWFKGMVPENPIFNGKKHAISCNFQLRCSIEAIQDNKTNPHISAWISNRWRKDRLSKSKVFLQGILAKNKSFDGGSSTPWKEILGFLQYNKERWFLENVTCDSINNDGKQHKWGGEK